MTKRTKELQQEDFKLILIKDLGKIKKNNYRYGEFNCISCKKQMIQRVSSAKNNKTGMCNSCSGRKIGKAATHILEQEMFSQLLIKDLGILNKKHYGIFACIKCKKEHKSIVSDAKRNKSGLCRICKNTKYKNINIKIYTMWNNMKQRCLNKKHKLYIDYGKRGILIEKEWIDNFIEFEKYVLSLKDAYKRNYSIDRIDNNRGYCYGNLRWSTQETQVNNVRILRKNNTSGYRGVSSYSNGTKFTASIENGLNNKNPHKKHGFKTALEAANYREQYIIDNNLNLKLNNL